MSDRFLFVVGWRLTAVDRQTLHWIIDLILAIVALILNHHEPGIVTLVDFAFDDRIYRLNDVVDGRSRHTRGVFECKDNIPVSKPILTFLYDSLARLLGELVEL